MRYEAKNVRPTHRFYPSRVRFEGEIKQGRRTHQIAIDVDPDLILKLADAIRATGSGECPNSCDQYRYATIGHAVWHVQNPDMPMPCIDHSKVIDMDALAEGTEP